jgi:hypothetical protein
MKTIHILTAITLTLTLGLFAGCGKKDEGKKADGKDMAAPAAEGKVASCNLAKSNNCREYRDANLAAGTDGLKQLCEGMGGTFGDVACPTEKMTGTCKVLEHKDFYYEGYPIPLPEMEKACAANKGTWTAAPAK